MRANKNKKKVSGNKLFLVKEIERRQNSPTRLRRRHTNINDLIYKNEPSEEQKLMIQNNVENSKVKTSTLNAIKLSMKLEGLFKKKEKVHYQAFYNIQKLATIDQKHLAENLKAWYEEIDTIDSLKMIKRRSSRNSNSK